MTKPKRLPARTLTLAVLAAVLLFPGCGTSESAGAEGGVLEVDAPLEALAWDPSEEVLYGVEQDGRRLVKIDPEELSGAVDADGPPESAVDDSVEIGDAGENLAVDPRRPGRIFVPQPDQDRVYVVGAGDLLEVQSFDAGVPPARVALDRRSNTLFALSEDDTTLTRVDLAGNEVTAEARVGGIRDEWTLPPEERDFFMEAAGDGSVWVADPRGVSLHGGDSLEPVGRVSSARTVGLAADPTNPDRAYAIADGGDRVVAVELGAGDRLGIVDEAELDAEAEYLAADAGRVYAGTAEGITALDSRNLETAREVPFDRWSSRDLSGNAKPAAMVAGEERVYVALEGEPYVLGIGRP